MLKLQRKLIPRITSVIITIMVVFPPFNVGSTTEYAFIFTELFKGRWTHANQTLTPSYLELNFVQLFIEIGITIVITALIYFILDDKDK